ncbi:hypothetical protein V6N13_140467 [Hibiscus sabdariffa]
MFQTFMEGEVSDWICTNLQNDVQFAATMADWAILFGTINWNLWLSRNSVAFDNPQAGYESILECSWRLQLTSRTTIILLVADVLCTILGVDQIIGCLPRTDVLI